MLLLRSWLVRVVVTVAIDDGEEETQMPRILLSIQTCLGAYAVSLAGY